MRAYAANITRALRGRERKKREGKTDKSIRFRPSCHAVHLYTLHTLF